MMSYITLDIPGIPHALLVVRIDKDKVLNNAEAFW